MRFTVPLLSCWLERAAGKRCPTSPPSSAGPGRGCAEALRTSSVAGTGPSRRDAQPRPRGWKQRGLGAGGRGGALWRSCVWLVRSVRAWGGAGVRNPEVGDLVPSAWDISCARSASYCAGAAGAGPRALRRGAVGRGGPSCSCSWLAGLRRPGRLGRWAERMGLPRR